MKGSAGSNYSIPQTIALSAVNSIGFSMQQVSHKLENTPSQALRPFLRNALRHRKEQIKQGAASIERSGAEKPGYSNKRPPDGQDTGFPANRPITHAQPARMAQRIFGLFVLLRVEGVGIGRGEAHASRIAAYARRGEERCRIPKYGPRPAASSSHSFSPRTGSSPSPKCYIS